MNARHSWALVALALALLTAAFALGQRSVDDGLSGQGPGADGPSSPVALRLEVDLSSRVLVVKENGEVKRTYPVTVGASGHPTPTGSYRIGWLVWNPSWTPPDSEWARGRQPMGPGPDNPMGRVKLYFRAPAYYIHGTNRDDQIGHAASHGCVRLRNEDVIELARLVMEHGGELRSPGWFQRVINRFRDTEEVRLGRSVPLVIA